MVLILRYIFIIFREVSMKIEEYRFNAEAIEQLQRYRDHQSDGRLRQRFIALLMLAQGCTLDLIVLVLGISLSSLKRWVETYVQQGIEALNSFQYQSKSCYLNAEQSKELKQWVKENLPGNREVIQAHILKTYGVDYHLSSISKLLKRLGLKKLRPRLHPGKPPSLEKQVQFILRYHQLREFEQLDPAIVQLFVDGAHLIHQVIPALCWADPSHPPLLSTNTSRQRLNILGAYHPLTQELVHLTSEANCDANQVILFLDKVALRYAHCHSIILHLDNAPYFHATLVQQWLQEHPQVILNPLPAYAPNLNLIERLWRFVKEQLVHNRYYEKYKTFRASTFRLLNHISEFEAQLKTLINDKFELIGNFNA